MAAYRRMLDSLDVLAGRGNAAVESIGAAQSNVVRLGLFAFLWMGRASEGQVMREWRQAPEELLEVTR